VIRKTRIADSTYTTYTWDHRNQLANVRDFTAANVQIKRVLFEHDAFGRRVVDYLDRNGDNVFEQIDRWFNDGTNRLLQFRDYDGQTTTAPARVSNRFLHGDAADRVLADENFQTASGPTMTQSTASTVTGVTLWTATDLVGSARDLVDNNGVVRKHVAYDSFGKRLSETNRDAAGAVLPALSPAAVDFAFGYTGADTDPDVGMTNHDNRWYDANTGRWFSQDPIGFAAGDANLYRYVGNGPMTKTDPSGLNHIFLG